MYIVSRQHIQKHWVHDPSLMGWFRAYCWPITENTLGMWSSRPEDWAPVNHSCDASCWLDGVNVVARRSLKKGEQITLDYGTFCALPEMDEITCMCGASHCRGVIRPTDFMLPQVIEMYGDHVSDYVRLARERGTSAASTK